MRVGLYLRLSREDGEGESQSIQSQRLLLTKFCQQQGFAVAAEYVDDGYSGTTFQRPAFAKMLADIEQGRIDTVITKDLSRLGRDYILTGHYLERYFPAHGVRYIALGDNIDTGRGQDDMAPFRAVVNDLYARDISRKVRASLLAKKQAGLFIGARPPYGYRRQAEDKNRLEPDPDTAGVVKQIFCWAAAGWGATAIARRLEEMGVAGPTHNAPWSSAMVRRILTNPTYCGCLTQNRSRKVSYKVEKSRPLPPEEWITVEGTHPAIVSPTLFQAVQSSRRQTVRHPLAGKAWCALCGAAMTFTTDGARRYLVCSGRRKGTGCSLPLLREEAVEQAVLRCLKGELAAAAQATGGETCRKLLENWPAGAEEQGRLLAASLRRLELGPAQGRVFWLWSPEKRPQSPQNNGVWDENCTEIDTSNKKGEKTRNSC